MDTTKLTQILQASKLSASEAATAEKIKSNFLLRGKIAATISVLQKSGCTLQQAQQVVLNICKAQPSHIQSSSDEHQLLQAADSVIAVYRKQKNAVIDQNGLQRTYPSTGSNSPRSSEPGNEGIKDKIPERSEGESRSEYILRLTSAGYSLAGATAAANIRFPPGPATQGGTRTTEVKNWGAGGGKSRTTITIPKPGIKQASIPSWAIASSGMTLTDLERIPSTSNLKSASEVPAHYFGSSIADTLQYRNVIKPQREREARAHLLSAKKEEKLPAWYILHHRG